jgi:hypothetical protein
VFVIDVKTWRDVRIEHGRLWHGDAPADESLDRLRDQTTAIQEILLDVGLPPSEVVPLLVLAGRRRTRATLAEVQILGEYDLGMDLLRRGVRLAADQVEQVVACLESACPKMPDAREGVSRAPAPALDPVHGLPEPRPAASRPAQRPDPRDPPLPDQSLPDQTLPNRTTPDRTTPEPDPREPDPPLFDVEEVWAGLIETAAANPVEAWMTFLHPAQARLVTRTWSGPARIRGAAGTGKTVVALHRASHLARRGRRVLFASYVHNLGPVFAGLFAQLAPGLTDRVDFASVHQVAFRLLSEAGTPVRMSPSALDTCFARAWSATRSDGILEAVGQPPGYWRDEIAHVIKGRGITDLAGYLGLARVGRGTRLTRVQREAVWRLYGTYQRLCAERGLTDWDDVLALALRAVRSGAVTGPWDAVIVDEVQDLTGVGLQLLHALVGNVPDGLLLVGDGQQSVYPGGFSLAETGISVAGRAVVLDCNYRNAEDILRYALTLLGADPFDDLDDVPAAADRSVRMTRRGGEVVRAVATDDASQRTSLLARVEALRERHGVRLGDVAVLVSTNAAARTWRSVLDAAGVPAMLLTDYDGRTVDAVKVGTFERGKGLEFAHVLIPDSDRIPAPRRAYESDEAYAERAARERRRRFVGMVRARDGLWLGLRESPD